MELTMQWWQLLLTALGTLGGFEFIKWIFNRKRVARADEFKLLSETNVFLQKQLKEKEVRFDEQTQLVRRLNTEVLDLTREKAEMEIGYLKRVATLELELVEVRCNDKPCPFRTPPNAHTPPKKGLTKEQYHSQKQITE